MFQSCLPLRVHPRRGATDDDLADAAVSGSGTDERDAAERTASGEASSRDDVVSASSARATGAARLRAASAQRRPAVSSRRSSFRRLCSKMSGLFSSLLRHRAGSGTRASGAATASGSRAVRVQRLPREQRARINAVRRTTISIYIPYASQEGLDVLSQMLPGFFTSSNANRSLGLSKREFASLPRFAA